MNNDMETIHRNVLQKIQPTSEDHKKLTTTIQHLIKQIKDYTKQHSIPITIQLVGSTAKDTYLKHTLDIDLFLCFPPTTSREELESIGLSIGRAMLIYKEECFAEHPYIRGEYEGFKTELVPCYTIKSASQKLSAVDRTPLHTTYILSHLKGQQKNEVRLFKQFLRGIGCYGAEAEIEGFSGYLCEILILKYGSFLNIIEQATNWKKQTRLNIEKDDQHEFDTPLIFIDPVDPTRNVSSALSTENYHLFIKACQSYQQQPSITFFFPNPLDPWPLAKIIQTLNNKEILAVKINKPNIIPENLYPQVRKTQRAILELCAKHDFIIIDSFHYINDTSFYIILQPKHNQISPTNIHMGPPTALKKNVQEFLKKWKENPQTIQPPYIKNDRYYVEKKRNYTQLTTLLEDKIKDISLGKHINHIVLDGFSLLKKQDLLLKKYRLLWSHHLDTQMPWER